MKPISTSELKNIQLDILKDVHHFCTTNNIRYSLIYGTLLGAIRHKGFIPWDDDIDIAMPREDYEKFIHSYKSTNSFYHLYDYRNDPEYIHPYAKIADTRTIFEENISMKAIGINIDIFPIDNLFDTEQECNKFINKLNLYKRLFRIKLVKPGRKNKFIKRLMIHIAKILCFPISAKRLTILENKIIQDATPKESQYVGLIVESEIKTAYKSIFPSTMFNELIKTSFEGNEFYIISSYDQWLKKMYGDYMTPPPKNQQTSPHTLNHIYWL